VGTPTDAFAGRWALVTRATGGIGSAVVGELAALGARVALIGLRRVRLEPRTADGTDLRIRPLRKVEVAARRPARLDEGAAAHDPRL
jgi:NAD(P)-dependent dehydrogenase (short-subunit alcohol dehydrogenase family)